MSAVLALVPPALLLPALLLPAIRLRAQQPPSPPAAAAAEIAQAQSRFAEKNYKESLRLSASVAGQAVAPELRLAALLLQAKSLINLGDFSAADPVLRKFLFTRADSPEALYLFGYVLERENKARESLQVFTRAAALASPSPNDLKLVALDYVLLEDYPDAIHWLERSLAGDPANAEAWYFLGRAHMQGGAFAEAERNFRRALVLSPEDTKALDNLGLSLEAQNRPEEAATAYRQAIAKLGSQDHVSEQPLLNLGTLLNNENHSAEALPLLARAVKLAPGSVRCLEELSRAEIAAGHQSEGIAAMEHASALDPKNPRLHFRLGQLYRHAGQTAKANAEIELSTKLYGTHSSEPEH